MNPLVIEIHGTFTYNRGGQLMALAIKARLEESAPGVRLAVSPEFGTYEERARYGLYCTDAFPGRVRSRAFARLVPEGIRRALGLVHDSEISAVLDASGFAFSDKWGPKPAQNLAELMAKRSRRHQKLILLPQALGPFRGKALASNFQRLLKRSDLVFARDQTSFEAAQEFEGREKLRLCPDFTVLMEGRMPDGVNLPPRFGAIVPNYRMVDKTADRHGRAYVRLIERVVTAYEQAGITPLIVLHDSQEDRQLLGPLFEKTGPLQTIESSDPLILKGVLGKALAVMGSRFHGLVAALSQGVPCIGVGWSHKYKWLFADYGCPECFIEDWDSANCLESALHCILEPEHRAEVAKRLLASANTVRERGEGMWREVEVSLGLGGRCQPLLPAAPSV